MKAKVDENACVGTGSCATICPKVFQLGDDGLAHVIADPVPADQEANCREACDSCPAEAISVEE
jgi:ferredoxin